MTNEERNQVIEECAKVAELHAGDLRHFGSKHEAVAVENAADMIRAIKGDDSERAENIAKFYGSKGGQP